MGKKKNRVYDGVIDTSDPLTDTRTVTVDGAPLPKANAAVPGDFSWGYAGSGPGLLADALTVSLIGAMDAAVRGLLLDLISNLDEDQDWSLTSDQFAVYLQANLPAHMWASIQHHF